MPDKKCETDCRENLLEKMVTKSVLLKIAGIIITLIITLWTVGYSISSKDISRREHAISNNTASINKTREELASIRASLENIKDSQRTILQEIRRK